MAYIPTVIPIHSGNPFVAASKTTHSERHIQAMLKAELDRVTVGIPYGRGRRSQGMGWTDQNQIDQYLSEVDSFLRSGLSPAGGRTIYTAIDWNRTINSTEVAKAETAKAEDNIQKIEAEAETGVGRAKVDAYRAELKDKEVKRNAPRRTSYDLGGMVRIPGGSTGT